MPEWRNGLVSFAEEPAKPAAVAGCAQFAVEKPQPFRRETFRDLFLQPLQTDPAFGTKATLAGKQLSVAMIDSRESRARSVPVQEPVGGLGHMDERSVSRFQEVDISRHRDALRGLRGNQRILLG